MYETPGEHHGRDTGAPRQQVVIVNTDRKLDLSRFMAGPAYAVAFASILLPILNLGQAIWPLNPGDLMWRFGAVGLLGTVVVPLAFGALIGFGTALYARHLLMLRALAVLSACTTLVLMGATVSFVIDGTGLRELVQPGNADSFDVSFLNSLVSLGISVAVGLVYSASAFLAQRELGKASHRSRSKSPGDSFFSSSAARDRESHLPEPDFQPGDTPESDG